MYQTLPKTFSVSVSLLKIILYFLNFMLTIVLLNLRTLKKFSFVAVLVLMVFTPFPVSPWTLLSAHPLLFSLLLLIPLLIPYFLLVIIRCHLNLTICGIKDYDTLIIILLNLFYNIVIFPQSIKKKIFPLFAMLVV
ncbi:transmembrane protein, putative [Medicago truncatula]|uniref:Transmembrane protein, putative n=1 Tax=Medicago truncatula TaxID=3880 RepID=A0A072TH38_MEDTR|nr:transmembrane protein, putative [Medicago truncatula]